MNRARKVIKLSLSAHGSSPRCREAEASPRLLASYGHDLAVFAFWSTVDSPLWKLLASGVDLLTEFSDSVHQQRLLSVVQLTEKGVPRIGEVR